MNVEKYTQNSIAVFSGAKRIAEQNQNSEINQLHIMY